MIGEADFECDQLSELGTTVTLRIVPTRMSIWLRRSAEMAGLICTGFIMQF